MALQRYCPVCQGAIEVEADQRTALVSCRHCGMSVSPTAPPSPLDDPGGTRGIAEAGALPLPGTPRAVQSLEGEAGAPALSAARLAILLAAVAGCVVVVSIIVCWLESGRGMRGKESEAVAALKLYHSAQVMFHRYDWDQGNVVGLGCQFAPGTPGVLEYASDFRDLNACLDHDPINLIPAGMANATEDFGQPHCGYYFKDLRSIGGTPIDWRRSFGLCATPAEYRTTGVRTLVITDDGVVWAKDLGKSEFVMAFPADPGAGGWEKVE